MKPIDGASDQQNEFFRKARRDSAPVTIYLTNGKKLTGRIKSYDRFTLIVDSHSVEQLIFKHAISTVALGRPAASAPRSAPATEPVDDKPDAS